MLLRVFDEGGGWGDPYWGCLLTPQEDGKCYVGFVQKAPSLSQLRALKAAVKELGCTGYTYERGLAIKELAD